MKNFLKTIAVVAIASIVVSGVVYSVQTGGAGDDNIDILSPTWKDINIGGAQLSLPASSFPGEDEYKDNTGTDTGITTLAFDTGERISSEFEIQHDYEEGTNIYPHLHWQGIVAPAGGTDNVQWQLTYAISRNGNTLSPATVITTEDAFTTQYSFNLSSFDAIDCSSCQIGDQFLLALERISASSDEYGGDALLSTVGIHYQVDTNGSSQITSK